MVNENLDKNKQEAGQFGETYFSYYFKQRNLWITILLSFYALLDIIALILAINFTFDLLFNYFGFLMIFIGFGAIFFVALEKNYLIALIASILLGFIPAIEIISYFFIYELNYNISVLIVLALVLSVFFMILPILAVFFIKEKYLERIKDE